MSPGLSWEGFGGARDQFWLPFGSSEGPQLAILGGILVSKSHPGRRFSVFSTILFLTLFIDFLTIPGKIYVIVFHVFYCRPWPFSAYDFVLVWFRFMKCLLDRRTFGDLRSTQ